MLPQYMRFEQSRVPVGAYAGLFCGWASVLGGSAAWWQDRLHWYNQWLVSYRPCFTWACS